MLHDDKFSPLAPSMKKEMETWVVNNLKEKIIKKLDNLLEIEGRINARKLFLVPISTVADLSKRVEEHAPEIKTFFYKELVTIIDETERKLA